MDVEVVQMTLNCSSDIGRGMGMIQNMKLMMAKRLRQTLNTNIQRLKVELEATKLQKSVDGKGQNAELKKKITRMKFMMSKMTQIRKNLRRIIENGKPKKDEAKAIRPKKTMAQSLKLSMMTIRLNMMAMNNKEIFVMDTTGIEDNLKIMEMITKLVTLKNVTEEMHGGKGEKKTRRGLQVKEHKKGGLRANRRRHQGKKQGRAVANSGEEAIDLDLDDMSLDCFEVDDEVVEVEAQKN